MRLRKKLLAAVVIITILTILSTSVITQFILLDQIQDYEKKTAGQELRGLVWVINDRIRSEKISATDWSNWDDVYKFVQDGNEEFIQSSLVDETYYSCEVNTMLFINESGEIVHGRFFDLNKEKEIDIPKNVYQSLVNHGVLFNDTREFESSAGLLILNDSMMLFSAYKILTSTGEGPAKGILVRAAYIDPGEIAAKLGSNAESFKVSESQDFYDGEPLPKEGVITYHIEEGPFLEGRGTIYAITVLNDVYGEPLTLEMEMERDIYLRGVSTLYFIVIAIIIIGIVSAGIYLVIFRSSVIMQLDRLGEDAGEIAESKDLGRRVDFTGDPEFMQLADSINKMLASLEAATNEKMENKKKYRELFHSILDGIVLTDIEGRIIDANSAFLNMSGINLESDDDSGWNISFFEIINKKFDSGSIKKITDRWKIKGNTLKFEAYLKTSQNETIPVELISWPFSYENGNIQGIWWIVRDVSEKKEIENIRAEALSNIEDNLERMAILNDEIRNPLSIIVGLVEMKCEAIAEEVVWQVEKIDQIINLLDRGWLRSKKVHEYLKKQYNFEGKQKNGDTNDEWKKN